MKKTMLALLFSTIFATLALTACSRTSEDKKPKVEEKPPTVNFEFPE